MNRHHQNMAGTMRKLLIVSIVAGLAFVTDISFDSDGQFSGVEFVSEAKAVAGTHRRTRRRSVAVGYSAGSASAQQQQQAQQQAEQPADQQAAQPAEQAPTATTEQAAAAAPAPVYGPLPEGTIVSVLPDGCAPVTSNNVEYQHCGDNYFRTAFQGNNLVYVASSIE